MMSQKEKEQVQIELGHFITEMKREGITTIVPHPEEIEKRIELIALLRGRRPDLYRLFLANVEQEGWIALSKLQDPRLDTMDAVRFIRTNSTSLDGKRSNQVVEIAKTESTIQARSILDVLKGKK